MPNPTTITATTRRRNHNLLLFSRLLSLHDNISPFTLILDSLAQSGKPLVREFVRRANARKTRVVYVAYETVRPPDGVDVFVKASRRAADVVSVDVQRELGKGGRTLIVIDTLNPLSATRPTSLPIFLSALLVPQGQTNPPPSVSILATYHTDVPVSLPQNLENPNPYLPRPLTLLTYLATTLLTAHSLTHTLALKAARDRSEPEPVFGLEEGLEGVLVGLGSNDRRGVVVEMEYRRRSGRGVGEWYFLPSDDHPLQITGPNMLPGGKEEKVILLVDHPLYKNITDSSNDDIPEPIPSATSTFNLDLTDKQRKAREEVVLPYYDAQSEGGVGEGGRIIYEMGWEDDFDEEEDEV
ncbi:MAG: hypothetical protein M1813_003120 [Trichoglossum hirsutum]|nr:MAG: hypothetical protein M1813_003120 [Trichoglossum hirsutum]